MSFDDWLFSQRRRTLWRTRDKKRKEHTICIGCSFPEKLLYSLSTVRRWVMWLGSQEEWIRRALDLIRQKCPITKIFRQVFLIPPCKYRCEAQKLVLERARKMLGLILEYEKYFPKSLSSKG